MRRFVLPMIVFTAFAAQAALADDPTPPSSAPSGAQAPVQPQITPGQVPPAQANRPSAVAQAQVACQDDIQRLCPKVQPGGGRILACLKEQKQSVSQGCKQAIAKAINGSAN